MYVSVPTRGKWKYAPLTDHIGNLVSSFPSRSSKKRPHASVHWRTGALGQCAAEQLFWSSVANELDEIHGGNLSEAQHQQLWAVEWRHHKCEPDFRVSRLLKKKKKHEKECRAIALPKDFSSRETSTIRSKRELWRAFQEKRVHSTIQMKKRKTWLYLPKNCDTSNQFLNVHFRCFPSSAPISEAGHVWARSTVVADAGLGDS